MSSTGKVEGSRRHVFAADPGKAHFAYASVSWENDKAPVLHRVGMITELVNDMRVGMFMYRVRRFYRAFKSTIEEVSKKHGKVTDVVMERFMARPGQGGGAVGESINIMIGIVALYCQKNGLMLQIIPASQWKNRAKRKHGLDSQAARYGYPFVCKDELKGNPYPVQDHQFDAVGIAQWFAETVPVQGQGRSQAQDHDHMPEFTEQLRKLWNKIAKETGYDESKDRERIRKQEERNRTKAEKGPKAKKPKTPSKKKKTGRKTRKNR